MFKRMLICMTALALIAGVAMKAEAATSADITVTVTLANISVSLSSGAWDMEIVAESSVNTSTTFTATNNGNVDEDLDISVTDSDGGWTAEAAAGVNQFAMDFQLSGSPDWVNITNAGVGLVDPLATTGTQDFTLRFTAPAPGSGYVTQEITVTVSASAS